MAARSSPDQDSQHIQIASIRLDGRTQQRSRINGEVVREFASLMREAKPADVVFLCFSGA
jgi:hypothetical protein